MAKEHQSRCWSLSCVFRAEVISAEPSWCCSQKAPHHSAAHRPFLSCGSTGHSDVSRTSGEELTSVTGMEGLESTAVPGTGSASHILPPANAGVSTWGTLLRSWGTATAGGQTATAGGAGSWQA